MSLGLGYLISISFDLYIYIYNIYGTNFRLKVQKTSIETVVRDALETFADRQGGQHVPSHEFAPWIAAIMRVVRDRTPLAYDAHGISMSKPGTQISEVPPKVLGDGWYR